jgi:outer membrane protein TolC
VTSIKQKYLSQRMIGFLLTCLLMSMNTIHADNRQPEKFASSANKKTYEAVLSRVIAAYPNLQSAILQVQRSTLELDRIYSTLGWQASAETSIAHDLGGFGTPADTVIARGALTRKLQSGDRISVDASYVRTDNEIVFINTLPNPSNDTAINLSYRKPFQKGAGNVEYYSLEEAAKAQISATQSEEFELRDALAKQVAVLYFGLATIEVNLANTDEGIDRLERLHEFVIKNKKLGISDEKDLLQSQARLDRKLAALAILETARNQQLFNLNRLMNLAATTTFSSQLDYTKKELPAREALQTQVFSYNPALNKAYAAKQTAESNINIQRDNKKDTLDVIVSVGARAKAGSTEERDIDETDLAGKVGLEYRAALDKSGLRAALQQALLSRDIADNQVHQLNIDLNNDIDRLLGLIRDQKKSINSNNRLMQAEKMKFDEAVSRYRTGRTTTADLIIFEEDLSLAESTLANSRVDLVSSLNELQRLRGTIWQGL